MTTIYEVKASIAELLSLIEQWEAENSAYSANQIVTLAANKATELSAKITDLRIEF